MEAFFRLFSILVSEGDNVCERARMDLWYEIISRSAEERRDKQDY